MTNEITKTTSNLPVKTFDEMQKLGQLFEKSGMFGCSAQGQGVTLVMTCLMSGQNPLEFIQDYHLIQGRPSMRADSMVAKFQERGGKVKILERTPELAKVELKKGEATNTFEFRWEDAKKEPFVFKKDGKTLKDNWNSPRSRMQMLWARVISDGVRAIDPGAVKGIYTPEETEDMTTNKKVEIVEEVVKPMTTKDTTKTTKKTEKKQTKKQTEKTKPDSETEDVSLVPAGKSKGKKWQELDTEVLNKFLASNHKSMTDGHKKRIKAILETRKEENK